MAYSPERDDMIVVPTYDIYLVHDMVVIEILERPRQPVLVNKYNPRVGSVSAHLTSQRKKLLKLPDTYPTVMAGYFDLHHPDWMTEPIAAAKAMAEWLQDKSFSLLNVHDYPTFYHHNHLLYSIRHAI